MQPLNSSSMRLMQQQISQFIQSLSDNELTRLLEIFEMSLQNSPAIATGAGSARIECSIKMLQYKCFESKIELHSKTGCGFGRTKEEAMTISIKNFFEVILLDESYLFLVQDCYRIMRGHSGSSNSNSCHIYTSTHQNPTSLSPNEIDLNLQLNQFNSNTTANQSASITMLDINNNNESYMYELQKKIGNISVINSNHVVCSSLNLNNNSHQDIDEMLLKIIQEEEEKTSIFKPSRSQQQQQQQPTQLQQSFQQPHPQHHLHFNRHFQEQQQQLLHQNHHEQQQDQQQQRQYNQILEPPCQSLSNEHQMNNTFDNGPLTQFQIYQIQLKSQQISVQHELPQFPSQAASSEKQSSSYQTYLSTLHPSPLQSQFSTSVATTAASSQQQQQSFTQVNTPTKQHQGQFSSSQERNALSQISTRLNHQNPHLKQQEVFFVISTPPNNKKRSSTQSHQQIPNFNNSSRTTNTQLNDTAFLPIKKATVVTTSNQKIQPPPPLHNLKRPGSLYTNKENTLATLPPSSSSGFITTNSLQSSIPGGQQTSSRQKLTTNFSHQSSSSSSQPALWTIASTQQTSCCSHKEDLDRERNKVESLEKRVKLLQEENKILKCLLLNPSETTAPQPLTEVAQTPFSSNKQLNTSKSNDSSSSLLLHNRSKSFDPRFKVLPTNTKEVVLPANNLNSFINSQATQFDSSNSIAVVQPTSTKKRFTYHQSFNSEQKFPQNSSSNARRLSAHLRPHQLLTTQGEDLDNSGNSRHSSVKKQIPKLNLQVLPNYHGNFSKILNINPQSSYHCKNPYPSQSQQQYPQQQQQQHQQNQHLVTAGHDLH